MSIADNIRKARKDAGLTQKELAKRCTFAEITIRQYETGKREPRSDRLIKIADALGVTVNHLIEYTDPDSLSEQEHRLLHLINKLNEDGKNEAVHILETLAKVPEYIHKGRDYND